MKWIKIIGELIMLFGKQIFRKKSEKIKNEWEKDKKELAKAIRDGDLDTIRRISAKYRSL